MQKPLSVQDRPWRKCEMKKTISILLLFVVILTSLVGCRSDGNGRETTDGINKKSFWIGQKGFEDYAQMIDFIEKNVATVTPISALYMVEQEIMNRYGVTNSNHFSSDYCIFGYRDVYGHRDVDGLEPTYRQEVYFELPSKEIGATVFENDPDFVELNRFIVFIEFDNIGKWDRDVLELEQFKKVVVKSFIDYVEMKYSIEKMTITLKIRWDSKKNEDSSYYADALMIELLEMLKMYPCKTAPDGGVK